MEAKTSVVQEILCTPWGGLVAPTLQERQPKIREALGFQGEVGGGKGAQVKELKPELPAAPSLSHPSPSSPHGTKDVLDSSLDVFG